MKAVAQKGFLRFPTVSLFATFLLLLCAYSLASSSKKQKKQSHPSSSPPPSHQTGGSKKLSSCPAPEGNRVFAAQQLAAAGQISEAASCLEEELRSNAVSTPNAKVRLYLSLIEMEIREKLLSAAEKHLREAVRISDADVGLRVNLLVMQSQVHSLMNDPDRAMVALQKCVELVPEHAQCHFLIGILHDTAENYESALFQFEEAININSNLFQPWVRAVYSLIALNRPKEALRYAKKGFDLDPQHSYASKLAFALASLTENQFSAAKPLLDEILELYPSDQYAQLLSARLRRKTCDWSQYDDDVAFIQRFISSFLRKDYHSNLDRSLDEKLNFGFFVDYTEGSYYPVSARAYTKWTDSIADTMDSRLQKKIDAVLAIKGSQMGALRSTSGPLRVGFLSSYLHRHPIGESLLQYFRHSNQTQIQIYCYSMKHHPRDAVQRDIKYQVAKFHDVSDLGSAEIAEVILKDKVQVLVDAFDHALRVGLETLSLKPALVQVSYLSNCDAVTDPMVDFILIDSYAANSDVLPPALHDKLVVAPVPFLLPGSIDDSSSFSRSRSSRAQARRQLGIGKHSEQDDQDSGFLYCNLGAPEFLDPVAFNTWLRILDKTSKHNTSLWVANSNSEAAENLMNAAQKFSSSSGSSFNGRLHITTNFVLEEDLSSAMVACDALLDTFTANDISIALSPNVAVSKLPFLSLNGVEGRCGMISSSMTSALTGSRGPLSNIKTPSDYENAAVQIAVDPEYFHQDRSLSDRGDQAEYLFDAVKYSAVLDSAFHRVLSRFLEGEPGRGMLHLVEYGDDANVEENTDTPTNGASEDAITVTETVTTTISESSSLTASSSSSPSAPKKIVQRSPYEALEDDHGFDESLSSNTFSLEEEGLVDSSEFEYLEYEDGDYYYEEELYDLKPISYH